MRAALAIAWKDVKAIYRTPSALAMMLIAPLVVATILGAAFGGSGTFDIQAVTTVVVDLDRVAGGGDVGVPTSRTIVQTLSSPELSDLIDVQMEPTVRRARQAVDDGDAPVAVIIPRGFSAAITSLSFSEATITYYQDPTAEVGPGIVRGIVGELLGEINGARAAAVGAAALVTSGPTGSGVPDVAALRAAAEAAAAGFVQSRTTAGVQLDERSATVGGEPAAMEPGITALVLAGQLVFFSLFGASTAARTILVEQQEGMLPRLFTTPARRRSILGGKFIASFLVVVVQTAVILIVGAVLFRIDWGAFLPVLVLAIVGPLVAAGLAMVIGSLSRTLQQEGVIGSGIFLVLALLGGNFTGTFSTTGVGQVLRRLTPNGWLLEGWDTAMRGGTLADIRLQVAVVLAFTVVFFSVAVVMLRRRFA